MCGAPANPTSPGAQSSGHIPLAKHRRCKVPRSPKPTASPPPPANHDAQPNPINPPNHPPQTPVSFK